MMLGADSGDVTISGMAVINFWYPLLSSVISGVIVAGVITWLTHHRGKRIERKVDETKYEITNEHTQPLRNDLDQRFSSQDSTIGLILSKLNDISSTQNRHDSLFRKLGKSVIGIRNDVSKLTNGHAQHTDDIEDLWREIERKGNARQQYPSE